MLEEKVKPLLIEKVIDQGDVRWGAVLDLLSSRYKIPYITADLKLKSLMKRLDLVFNPIWFIRNRLTADENRMIAALCEVLGADAVVLTRERRFSLGLIPLRYDQRVRFEPALGKDRDTAGRCAATVAIGIFKLNFNLRTASQIILTQLSLFAVAVMIYVVFVWALLRGLATFSVFLTAPAAVTMAATRRFDLWLGLLCFLVGVAGIFGQAIRNTSGLLWSKLRRTH